MNAKRKKESHENDLAELIKKRFSQLERKINDSQETLKDDIKRLEQNSKPINEASAVESFTAVVKSNRNTILPEFRKILRDEKLNKIEEERQHDLRQSNIMVFGRREDMITGDDKYVRILLKEIGVEPVIFNFLLRRQV